MHQVQQRFRQIHLDFHTSSACLDVGIDFDPDTFADTLQSANIDSINVFAKDCHGYCYYPTNIGTIHPNLRQPDLLGRQINALHERGIRCPLYLSIMWDDVFATMHPGSVVVDKKGRMVMRPPLTTNSVLQDNWGWSVLDVSTEYGTYTMALVEELCQNYPVDGFWFDICLVAPNYSPRSQAQMRAAGVDLEDDAAVIAYARTQLHAFLQRLSVMVHQYHPEASIFYNGTTDARMAEVYPFVTHFELESVPTSAGKWGYLHYPISARHARTYGHDFVGMTVAFQKEWADFGGIKTRDQLDYECGTILAAGGRISIGDQMHPRGELNAATYDLIGHAYKRVTALEPWLVDATARPEIGILLSYTDGVANALASASYTPDLEGFAQFCLEQALQFDIVDLGRNAADLWRYAALYLPEGCRLDDRDIEHLEAYLAGGGKLILTGMAGFDQRHSQFVLRDFPANYVEPAPTNPSYFRLDEHLAANSELSTDFDYVLYGQAYCVQPKANATTHGELKRALFNRSWRHFTSHGHAPVGKSLETPLVVQNDRVLYFAAPIFHAYRDHDYWAYRALAANALRAFLPEQLVKLTGPGWIEASLRTQPENESQPARDIVHLVAYHPRRTMQPIQHVDQSWTTANVTLHLRREAASSVYLAPERKLLEFSHSGGYISVELPPIGTHTVVVIE